MGDPVQKNNFTVAAEQNGQRLDNFLASRLKNTARSYRYKLVRQAQVRVNGKRAKAMQRLEAGDIVRIPPFLLANAAEGAKKTVFSAAQLQQLKNAAIYEDKQILVLNKPAGMAVHAGSGLNWGLIDMVRAFGPEYSNCELVHRLDRETSGCLVIAKKASMLKALQAELRDGKFTKSYLALVAGKLRGTQLVEKPLRKIHGSNGERRVVVDPNGKAAKTVIKPIRQTNGATLVRAELYTGRTHQIRVHCLHLGYPIIGDSRYTNGLAAKLASKFAPGLFLHAEKLCFTIPGSQTELKLVAPPPAKWQPVL